MEKLQRTTGKVFLIGAGPGDPKLLTLKGYELLKKVDVILYDNLANKELLNIAKSDCELIFVGKKAGLHFVSQDETIRMLIEKAAQGKSIARLKGGDPMIFGRGSEEALALKEKNIEFEIVPGITSGIAAAEYAGIPLTHRNLVTKVIFLTAHESPEKENSQIQWDLLAKMENTSFVIYMGVSAFPKIAKTLIEYGMAPDSKVLVVEKGTQAEQRSFASTLAEMPEIIEKEQISPPAIFVISQTVELKDSLKWFESKPLFGKTIVSTRANDQAESLYNQLSENGAYVIPFETIKTELLANSPTLDNLFNRKYDWVFFTSENGVRYLFQILAERKLDARFFANSKIAAIGTGTAKALAKYSIIPDFIPSKFTSVNFAEEFSKLYPSKCNILRIKGDFMKDILADALVERNNSVDVCEVYKTLRENPDSEIIEKLKTRKIDYFTFTSNSTVDNFFEILGNELAFEMLNNSTAVAIGPVTSKNLEEKGISNFIQSELHTIEGLVMTIIKHKY